MSSLPVQVLLQTTRRWRCSCRIRDTILSQIQTQKLLLSWCITSTSRTQTVLSGSWLKKWSSNLYVSRWHLCPHQPSVFLHINPHYCYQLMLPQTEFCSPSFLCVFNVYPWSVTVVFFMPFFSLSLLISPLIPPVIIYFICLTTVCPYITKLFL